MISSNCVLNNFALKIIMEITLSVIYAIIHFMKLIVQARFACLRSAAGGYFAGVYLGARSALISTSLVSSEEPRCL